MAASLAALGLTGNATRSSVPGDATLDPDGVVQELPVEETYRRQCAACHGQEGRGDGRAARRYNPRPADFKDPEGVAKLSDDELVGIITNGRASMPAFGQVLSEEALALLAGHVRELSRPGEG